MATIFGVLEKSGRRNLAPEPLNDLLARERPGQNHLQRDNAPETGLPSAIDHAHSAARDFFEQFVITEVTNPFLVGRGTPGTTGRIYHSGWGGEARRQGCRAVPRDRFPAGIECKGPRPGAGVIWPHTARINSRLTLYNRNQFHSFLQRSQPKVTSRMETGRVSSFQRSTLMRCRSSPSMSSGRATVCAISARSSSRNLCRRRCTATLTIPSLAFNCPAISA